MIILSITIGTGFHMYADDLVIFGSAVATWVQVVNTALMRHQLCGQLVSKCAHLHTQRLRSSTVIHFGSYCSLAV